jgi:hypothetical protein
MNRNRFIVAILALGGLAGAAEVRSTLAAQQQRLQDFKTKAQEARKAQDLDGEDDRKALVTKYPTPEIGFVQPQQAHGGAELTLSAPGRFLPDSLVLVPCEGVEVLSSKVTKERAEARVRILPTASSGECELQVVSPVSAISRSKPALIIRGDTVWELQLANGLTTRWTVESRNGRTLVGQSEWFEKGKSLGTRPVVVNLSGDDARASVGPSEEENRAAEQRVAAGSAGVQDTAKRMEALVQKMQTECASAPSNQRQECFGKYKAEMEAINKGFAAAKSTSAPSSTSTVCSKLNLKAVGGKLTGTADNCAGSNGVQVSGTYKPGSGK